MQSGVEAGILGSIVDPPRRVRSVGDMVAEGDVFPTFCRGWLHRLDVNRLTDAVRDAIAAAPLARLLAELAIATNIVSRPARASQTYVDRHVDLSPLAASPNVRNLRRLELPLSGSRGPSPLPPRARTRWLRPEPAPAPAATRR